MFALPKFPTDNLYKFTALAGLFILALSGTYPHMRLMELQEKVVELKTETKILDVERGALETQMKRMERDTADLSGLIRQSDGKRSSKKQVNALEAKLNELVSKREELERRNQELRVTSIRIGGKTEISGYLTTQMKLILNAMIAGIVLGSFLVIYGFRLWYQRVQKIQDQMLMRSVAQDEDATS